MDLNLPAWFQTTGRIALQLLPGGAFTIWCLFGINWRKTWPILSAGGWAVVVLVGVFAAGVWSLVWPSTAVVFGTLRVANGHWQLGSVGVLMGVALFCGWLQGRYGWTPAEIELEPPAHSHDDHHHSHDHHHSTH
ncbi:MAG: hypothetical protein U0746_00460 [Gemmataceae bacterium]